MTETKKPDLRIVIGADIPDDEIPVDVLDEEDGLGGLVFIPSEDKFWYGFNKFKDIDKVREYIIRGWLIAHNVTSFLASRGTGKSTIALDLGCHLACDMSWWGTPAMTGWKVIYICGEDDEGMILNCRAWAQHHGRAPTDDRFRIARGIIKMTNRLELEHRLKEMESWADGSRCLVILDTWQRSIAGTGSSNEEAMELAVENAETIAQALNGPMIICHHPPKDGKLTIKGSGVQEDTSSGIWTLKKVEDGVLVTITRAKGSGEENWRKFRFKKITLPGEDAFGDPLEGIVPIQISGEEESNSRWLAHQEKAAYVVRTEQVEYAYQVWKHVASDFSKKWTVHAMAEKLTGLSITKADGGRLDFPGVTQTTKKLNDLFMHPVRLPDEGVAVRLVDTGEKGPRGAVVRLFRVEKIAPDAGISDELPHTLE